MTHEVEKAELRRTMRKRRAAVSVNVRARAAEALSVMVLERADVAERLRVRGAQAVVAAYLATPAELDLAPLIACLLARQVRVVVPRWNGESYDLAVLRGLSPADVRLGPMDVAEPRDAELVPSSSVDVWLVPGLAFDRLGGRLGYGGGWYDRLLAGASREAIVLGVGYAFQLVDAVPTEEHDVRIADFVGLGNEFTDA